MAFFALLAILGAGCAGYRLGSTLPEHLKTLYVSNVVNETSEPELAGLLTRALNREFRRDGTLKLADPDPADIRLDTRITGFRLEPVAYDRSDPKAANDYRLILSAKVLAVERDGGGVLLNALLRGETLLASGGDLNSAQRAALPDAVRDLARHVVDNLISAW